MRRTPGYAVTFLPAAERSLTATPGQVQDRVRAAIRALAEDPFPADSQAMRGKGAGLYRLRVGMYRVVYRVRARELVVLIVRVGHREDVYHGLEPGGP